MPTTIFWNEIVDPNSARYLLARGMSTRPPKELTLFSILWPIESSAHHAVIVNMSKEQTVPLKDNANKNERSRSLALSDTFGDNIRRCIQCQRNQSVAVFSQTTAILP